MRREEESAPERDSLTGCRLGSRPRRDAASGSLGRGVGQELGILVMVTVMVTIMGLGPVIVIVESESSACAELQERPEMQAVGEARCGVAPWQHTRVLVTPTTALLRAREPYRGGAS